MKIAVILLLMLAAILSAFVAGPMLFEAQQAKASALWCAILLAPSVSLMVLAWFLVHTHDD